MLLAMVSLSCTPHAIVLPANILPFLLPAVCPGFVLTPLVVQQMEALAAANDTTIEQAGKDLLREKVPSEEFVTVEALGNLCSFLCTDNAKQMTGQAIAVDGGWTSQ